MSVWGVAVRLDGGEPVVTAIEATGPRSSATYREVFQHRADPNDEWPLKLKALADALDTELRKGAPAAAVVRRMDWFSRGRESVYRTRYGVEGVLLGALRRHVTIVDAQSGKEIASTCGLDKKADVETEARSIFGAEHVETGMAALAALVLADEA